MDAQKDHTVQLSNLSDFEKFAKNKLDSNAWGYYSCGADEEQTLRENIEAFKRYIRCRICYYQAGQFKRERVYRALCVRATD